MHLPSSSLFIIRALLLLLNLTINLLQRKVPVLRVDAHARLSWVHTFFFFV
jgi:hypothetical protein